MAEAKKEKMVKVRMLVGMASMSNDRNIGDTPSIPESEAKRLIEAGVAAPVTKSAKPETREAT